MSERHASRDMRDRIQNLLQKAADLTLYYWNKVNNAFTDKIHEQVQARNQLQTHLAKVGSYSFMVQVDKRNWYYTAYMLQRCPDI